MNNVKLIKSRRGYFLTIGEKNGIENRWATSALEMLTLLKILKDHEQEMKDELDEIKDEEGLSL